MCITILTMLGSLVRILFLTKTLNISTIQPCRHKLLLSVKSKCQKILTIRPTFSSHSWNCRTALHREYGQIEHWLNIVHHRSIRTWIHQCALSKDATMCTHHRPIVIDINLFSTTTSGQQCCRWWHRCIQNTHAESA